MMLRRKTASLHTVKMDAKGRHYCSVCGTIPRVYGNGSCPMVQRELVLREKYGLTQDDYDERLIALANRCSLCSGKPGATGLVVDHSHSVGHPRDLICMSCNVLLGHIEGDLERVKLAMEYVDKYRNTGAFPPR